MKKTLYTILFFLLSNYLFAQLEVTFPSNRAVFQRNNGNVGIIYIAGTYDEYCDKVEAKLTAINGGQSTDWTTIVESPNFGIFRGQLVSQAGWYKLEVRILYRGKIIGLSSVDKVGIGEVFLIAGQSNAQGYDNFGQSGAQDDRVNTITNFYSPIGATPIYPSFGHLDAGTKIAPSGNGAWYWGELGDKLAQKLNVPILFLNAANEGMDINSFRKSAEGLNGINVFSGFRFSPGYPYGTIKDALHFYANILGIRAILWHQGETDNFLNTPSNQYAQDLQYVINATRENTGKNIAWVVARVSYTQNRTNQQVIDGQNQVIATTSNVFAGPNTDTILDRVDGVHFSRNGLSKAATAWFESLNDQFFQYSNPEFGNPPLQLFSYCHSNNGNETPVRLSMPLGYSDYRWNNGKTTEFNLVGIGFHQGQARDYKGNVYYTTPLTYRKNVLSTKPTITALGNTSFCAGQSVTLETNYDSNTYWSTGSEGKRTIAYGGGPVTISYVNEFGCINTSDPININIYPTPNPQIMASGPTEICSDKTLSLTSSLDQNFEWNDGSKNKFRTITNNGEYFIKSTNEFGCSGQSEKIQVKIKPIPEKPEISILGNMEFCANDSTLLSVSKPINTRWNNGVFSPNLTVKLTGEYFAINRNEENCESISSSINIVVNPLPEKPTISVLGDTEFCSGENVTLKVNSNFKNQWTNGESSKEIKVNNSGIYQVYNISDKDCYSPISEKVSIKTFETPQNPNIIQSGTFSLKAINSSSLEGVNYAWKLNNDTLSINNDQIKARKPGVYTVQMSKKYVKSNNQILNCIAPFTPPYNYAINYENQGVSIYPNPVTDDVINIETLEDLENVTVSIYDGNGREIQESKIQKMDVPKQINISKIGGGVYLIKVKNNRFKVAKKIIIN